MVWRRPPSIYLRGCPLTSWLWPSLSSPPRCLALRWVSSSSALTSAEVTASEIPPASKAQADGILSQIQQDRGMSDLESQNPLIIRNLHNALSILSDDLNSKATHFLLELIQNADDCTYPYGLEPSLTVTLTKQGLMTSTNETGFTPAQVSALCFIGDSTKKKSTSGQRGFIGEKGIGFKSVFKVADVVDIRSGFFEFSLDRRQELGMILPRISPFPNKKRQGTTQMLLHLKSDEEYRLVKEELERVDPHILMLLRRIRKLRVTTPDSDLEFSVQASDLDGVLSGETKTVIVTDMRTGFRTEKRYLIARHTVSDMPAHAKRLGISESEVFIAFPVDDQLSPGSESQKAYAFLPIADYGFKFLIHADFLLVANRESVEVDNWWNQALKRGIVSAFLGAVRRFNSPTSASKPHPLRSTWPLYLSGPRPGSPFWDGVWKELHAAIGRSHVLESHEGDMVMPAKALLVTETFRFEGRDLLVQNPKPPNPHVSFTYRGRHIRSVLENLGARQMTSKDFIDDLKAFLAQNGPKALEAQPAHWHSALASTIVSPEFKQFRETIKSLPLIPVAGGEWLPANTPNLHLPTESANAHIPKGLGVLVVDENACSDPERAKMFRLFGLTRYNPGVICRRIVELHGSSDQMRTGRPIQEWIEDGIFLFKNRDLISSGDAKKIRFVHNHMIKNVKAPRATQLQLGQNLYLDDSCDLIRRFSGDPFSCFKVPHRGYVEGLDGDELKREFYEWLDRSCCAHRLPRLFEHRKVTREFEFLASECPGELIQLLADEQDRQYRPIINDGVFAYAMRRLKVTIAGGRQTVLESTLLPTAALRDACPSLPFLDMPGGPHISMSKYQFLAKYGVQTKVTIAALLRELENSKKQDVEIVHRVYRSLATLASDHECRVATLNWLRAALVNRALIRLPSEPGARTKLMKSTECIWDAFGLELKTWPALSNLYRDCAGLFKDALGIPNLQTKHILDELVHLQTEGATEQILECLVVMSRLLEEEIISLSESEKTRLQNMAVFPVRQSGSSRRCSMIETEWYIPDRPTLAQAFEDVVGLLDVPREKMQKLLPLFRQLGLEDRYLSSSVTCDTQREGASFDKKATKEFQKRLRHILQLTAITRKLQAQVWHVSKMTSKKFIGSIQGRPSPCDVDVDMTDEEVHIYVSKHLASSSQYVDYLLVHELCELLEISVEGTSLVMVLLRAPLGELPRILDEHGISQPSKDETIGKNETSDEKHEASFEAPFQDIPQSTTVTGSARASFDDFEATTVDKIKESFFDEQGFERVLLDGAKPKDTVMSQKARVDPREAKVKTGSIPDSLDNLESLTFKQQQESFFNEAAFETALFGDSRTDTKSISEGYSGSQMQTQVKHVSAPTGLGDPSSLPPASKQPVFNEQASERIRVGDGRSEDAKAASQQNDAPKVYPATDDEKIVPIRAGEIVSNVVAEPRVDSADLDQHKKKNEGRLDQPQSQETTVPKDNEKLKSDTQTSTESNLGSVVESILGPPTKSRQVKLTEDAKHKDAGTQPPLTSQAQEPPTLPVEQPTSPVEQPPSPVEQPPSPVEPPPTLTAEPPPTSPVQAPPASPVQPQSASTSQPQPTSPAQLPSTPSVQPQPISTAQPPSILKVRSVASNEEIASQDQSNIPTVPAGELEHPVTDIDSKTAASVSDLASGLRKRLAEAAKKEIAPEDLKSMEQAVDRAVHATFESVNLYTAQLRPSPSSTDSHTGGDAPTGMIMHRGSRSATSLRRELPGSNGEADPKAMLIGLLGEAWMHNWLSRDIPDWSADNWTSKSREGAGLTPFEGDEKNNADFTYVDRNGHMRHLLHQSLDHLDVPSTGATFHIEVKAVSRKSNRLFALSQNQLDMARKYAVQSQQKLETRDSSIFMLALIQDIDTKNPSLSMFVDPWKLYVDGKLDLYSPGGYEIQLMGDE